MKKIISVLLIVVLLIGSLFALTGCVKEDNSKKESKEEKKSDNTVEISRENGKGTFTLSVPKNEDGTPKYNFTDEKPENAARATFYLQTDTAIFSFSTSGLAYNTSKAYKEEFGETKATFDGYLEWMANPKSGIKLSGMEQLELNGRKALRYYNRTGSSNDYKYLGYFYMVAGDDIYPGSHINMAVRYNDSKERTEVEEFDEETLSIIKSLKVTLNQ